MSTQNSEKPRILIIDDDPHHNRIVSALLRAEGFDVKVGWSSVEAIHKNFDYKPDLVLLDIMMPGFAGTSACAALRQLQPDLPVVMVSAKTSQEDVMAGFDYGCTRYLTKPFDPDALIATVKELLGNAKKEKDKERGKP